MPYPNTVHDDEVQRLITNVFRATGYRLDRRDPILAQYVVQKILLEDFDKKQALVFDELCDRIIPALKEEGKKLEEQKRKLADSARFAANDVVERAGESFLERIRDAIREKDSTIQGGLGEHAYQLQQKHDAMLRNFKAQCDKFQGQCDALQKQCENFNSTAEHFPKTLAYFFFGKCLLLAIAVYFAVEIFRA